MDYYQTKARIIPTTSYKTVEQIALNHFKEIKRRTKRTPYIRSAYFNKEKVFLNIFWSHLHDKHENERTRRLKYFECALDLIKTQKSPRLLKLIPINSPNHFIVLLEKLKVEIFSLFKSK